MRNSRLKRIFSALLCAILLLSFLAFPVSAEIKISDTVLGEDTDYIYGYYRKYVHWSIRKSSQTLTIFGNEGEEYDETIDSSFYYTHHIAPFSEYIRILEVDGKIRSIEEGALAGLPFERAEIANGLKRIEANAFADCKKMEKIVIPASVEYIGRGAFEGCDSLKSVFIFAENVVIDEGAFPDTLDLKRVHFYGDSIEIKGENENFSKLVESSQNDVILPVICAILLCSVIVAAFVICKKKHLENNKKDKAITP